MTTLEIVYAGTIIWKYNIIHISYKSEGYFIYLFYIIVVLVLLREKSHLLLHDAIANVNARFQQLKFILHDALHTC